MIPPACSGALSRVVSTLAVVFAVCNGALAQEAARPDRGTALNRSFAISDIENINLQNGNVNLSIPLASLPPIAGGKLSSTVNVRYNSKLWDVLRFQEEAPDLQWSPYVVDMPAAEGGWAIGGGYAIYFRNANEDFYRVWYDENSGLPQWERDLLNDHQWWKVVLLMPDGSEHELRPIDYGSYYGSQDFLRGFYNVIPNGSPIRYHSVDGTYMFAHISGMWDWTVYLPDGTKVIQTPDGVQRIQDTNGNKIKLFSDTAGSHIQDEQTGREIKITYDPAANGGLGQYRVWYPTVGGTQHYIDINMGSTTVQGKTYPVNDWDSGGEMVCQRTAGLYTQLQVVREIIFPPTQPGQQRKFVFSYNSDTTENTTTSVNWSCNGGFENYTRAASAGWGELSRVISPPGTIETAAYSDYSYGLDSEHSLAFSPDDLAKQSITQKQLYHDGISDTWTYSISDVGTGVTSPDGSWFSEQRYCATFGVPNCATDKAGLAYRTTRPFLRTEKHWINLAFSGGDSTGPGGVIVFNPVVDFEYTTLLDAGNNPLKMSAKAFQYDYNGNLTQTKEYDWFDHNLVSRDAQGVPTGVPASATLLRTINHSHYNQAVGSTSSNVYAKRSVSTGAPLILNAPKETTLGPSIVQFSYDGQAYGVAPTVGNLTAQKVWVDLDAKWLTTSNTYGLYGNIATATDARGKVTQFFYDDATHALPNRVVVDPQNGTGTQTTTTAFDYYTGLVTSQTDANGQVTTIDYTNQQLGTVDPYGRPGITKSPTINIGGSNHRRRVTTTYLDATRQVIVAADLNAENDKLLKTRTTVDMLGRPVLTESTEDGTNYTISVKNAYLDMGRVTLTASPMRSTAASTDSWTRVTKDIAGRAIEVATFGGAAQPDWSGTSGVYTGKVMTAYDANFTTVTDQAGKVRRSMVDGIGRLLRVDEPDGSGNLGSTAAPVQPTSYGYDVFGNLLTVTQGSQTRSFTYDSLSRLRTAVNPESGTISYKYDDNGNLLVKTDARSVSAHFEYDALNRVTRRWYNGSGLVTATTHNSPALPSGVGTSDQANFYYDTQALPAGAPSYSRGLAIGRLVAQTYGTGSSTGDYYAFDVLGRATLKIQQTGTFNYQMSAVYSLSSALTSLTYPSGRTITNSFDLAGRLSGFSGNLGDGTTRTYSSGILYSATGGLVKEQFGTTTPIFNKLFYNSRGQLAEIRESTSYTGPTDTTWDRGAIINNYSDQCTGVCSGSSMADNNGNLKKQEIHIPNQQMRWQQYDYDSLNRLNWAREVLDGGAEQWKQQFTYDRWGNRTINTANTYGIGINNKAFTVNTANNRLGVPGGQSGVMSYDAAGNLTNDTYTGAGNRTYDAENKITSAWGGNNQAQLYGYDTSGQRIKRTVDGVETWQVYDFGGELLAEYPADGDAANPQKEYGYRNGQLLVTLDSASGLNGYSQRRTITIDHTKVPNTDQSNFPVLIQGTYAYLATLANGGNVQHANGYDVIFSSDSNCATKLDHEVETYNPVTGAVNYWVKVPSLSHSTDTTFYLCYGNASVTTDQSNKTAVWDANYKGVWHLNDNAANTIVTDSTGASNGTNQANTSSKSVPGRVGGALSYNGSSDYTDLGTNVGNYTLSDSFTLEAWINPALDSANRAIYGNAYALAGYLLRVNTANKARFILITDGSNYNGRDSSVLASGWHHVVGVWNGSGTPHVYIDGELDNAATVSGGSMISITTSAPTRIGATPESGFGYESYFNGTIDEVRSSKTARSADWIKTQYNNQNSPSTFYTISAAIGGSANLHWLVADQLGTPRMIFDQTGSLAGVKRHDYLPFGEELFAPTGGRSAAQGYSGGDGVRQQFTQKERDIETGLDYFLARYYSSTQGRFTSPDEFAGGPDELYYFVDDASANPTFYADLRNPQSLNKYQYSYNNPLRYIDPDGHDPEEPEPPQDPRPVLPLPPIPGMPPLVVPGSTTSTPKGPTDAEIIEGGKAVLDTVADYTGITWIADKIRPFCPFCPKPAPAPAPAPAQPTTGTPPQSTAQPLPPPPPVEARHRSNRRKSNWDKHTNPRPGDKKPPGYRWDRRPQPKPKPAPAPPKPKPTPKPEIGPGGLPVKPPI